MTEEEFGAILARVDERTRNIEARLDWFVTKDEFAPVRRIVYGAVGVALTILAVALLGLVVVGGGAS